MGGPRKPARPGRRRRCRLRSVRARREERELFFWTARETLKLIALITLTAYFSVSLIRGRIAGSAELLDVAGRIMTLLR